MIEDDRACDDRRVWFLPSLSSGFIRIVKSPPLCIDIPQLLPRLNPNFALDDTVRSELIGLLIFCTVARVPYNLQWVSIMAPLGPI